MIEGDGLMERFGTKHLFHLGRWTVHVRLVGTAQQLPQSAKSSPSALGDTRPGALEPFYGSAGKSEEDGNLRVHVSHLVEDGGDFDEMRNDECPTLWAGLCQDGTHSPIRQVLEIHTVGRLFGLGKGELLNVAAPEGCCIQERQLLRVNRCRHVSKKSGGGHPDTSTVGRLSIVDKETLEAMRIDRLITLSSHSVVALGQPIPPLTLPSICPSRPWIIHSGQ
ncbi:hypothetical protein TNCV_4294201 [Trichonephila clavipes]|uniref:Uncharacterized protein n=1 Tax=Trichonephila clavipes TaxID=2585209 RepID=A0A8X6RHR8_TRICX|nr:hypothetical protein TNCV_4294201 [Trichonephila clavipes]